MSPGPDTPDGSPGAARLDWSDDRPRSVVFDDIYFAPDGPAESRTVFLRGCGLPEAWAGRRRFTVAELGFGTGLNLLALLQLWREHRPAGGRLHLFSVEAYPLSAAEAARALSVFPEMLELAAPLLRRWPGALPGFERYDWPELGVALDLATLEAGQALEAWSGPADAWFLDGFAPSRNPEMWRPEVLDLVTARSAPDAQLATFTVAGAVRRGLSERGWTLARAPGHGGKRERLEARLPGPAPAPAPERRIRVIGGGIAGASLARAFDRLGVACTVVDPTSGSGASGNPAALVAPRLDAGGGPVARLSAQAFARAATLYEAEAPEAVVRRGALRLAGGPKDLSRFERIVASGLFRPGSLTVLDPDAASERLGEAAPGALWMDDGLTVAPESLLNRWLSAAERAASPRAEDHEITCIAAGMGSAAWTGPGVLEPVAGQASWSDNAALPGAPASWGGYAVPLPSGGVLFGATHGRGQAEPVATPEADHANLSTLAARLPALAAQAERGPLSARAAVRATTPDRLPIAGALGDDRFVLTGLGGRGFTWAPLLAEHVAALAVGAPSPLPRDLAALVDPKRFEARRARRGAAGRRTGDR